MEVKYGQYQLQNNFTMAASKIRVYDFIMTLTSCGICNHIKMQTISICTIQNIGLILHSIPQTKFLKMNICAELEKQLL